MAGSNTFCGTIKLEGEKSYREAIKQINSDLKVMASEMGKVTAEFGKNDKSASSLTSRNKILAEQIDKQKEKILTLKGALEQSSEKYGENGSQCAAPGGRKRRADEQEKTQRIASSSAQGDNVFDR